MAYPGNPNQPGGGPCDTPKFFNPSAPSSTVMTTNFPTSSNFQSPSSNAVKNPGTPQQPFPLPSASFPPPIVGPAAGPYSFLHPTSSPFHKPPSEFFHPFHPQQFNASGGNPPSSSSQEPPSQFSNHLHPHPPQRSVSFPTPPLQPPLTSSPHSGQFPGPQNSNVNNVNNTNETPGARLMALLSAKPPVLELSQQPAVPMTHVQPMTSGSSDLSTPHSLPMIVSGPSTGFPDPGSNPMRMPSSKLPRGRHLIGDHVVYDINVRLPGEVQPQLEVTPITKYGSDPGLVLGRQIAVNKTYICYGLKLGAIRVLNINTALRSLLKGLAQRVTDMAFFAEDVHLLSSASVDGRVYIWKISEDPDEEDKPQITVKIVTAVQFNVDGESVHPRVCWHCHKQEVLVIGIGRHILKIDTIKVGKREKYSAEEPLKCPIDKLIDGIQLIGSHDGEVTDLSMCQWMTTRLVSASVDGTIKIWEDRKMLPIAVLRPYDGRPVNSVTFLTAPHRPDHIILITGGPLNREVKIWISASEEGWLLPSDSESWRCIQTLELKSYAESHMEEAFFNQVIALSQVGLIVLANAKKNAIYAVHLDFGSYPASSRMDYVAEFTVTMPILSFTGTSNMLPHDEQIVQVYCIQTQAIQQYALDLSQCLPPPLLENALLDKSGSNASRDAVIKATEITVSVSAPTVSMLDTGSSETKTPERHVVNLDSSDLMASHEIHVPMSPRLSRNLSGLRSPTKSSEPGPLDDGTGDSKVIESSVDRQRDGMYPTFSDVGSIDHETRIDGNKVISDDISTSFDMHVQFKHPTHLVTPSEILMANSSSEVNNDVSEHGCDAEVNVQDEIGYGNSEIGSREELNTLGVKNKEKLFYSQASDLGMQISREARVTENVMQVEEEACRSESSPSAQPSALKEDSCDTAKDVSGKIVGSDPQVPQAPQHRTKGKKKKGKYSLGSSPLSPSPSTSYLSDPVNDSGTGSSIPSLEAVVSCLISMQEKLNQLVPEQKEMLKQMNTTIAATVAVPVTKEGRRLEASLGRSIEKSVKANNDVLWARFQEDTVKHEKSSKDRNQQMMSLVNNCINKDLPAMVEKAVQKEFANLGQAVARTIVPVIEKTISSVIVDSFQKGVADKAVNQLEKSLNSKLESTVARQIQTQFQTSGKQALQETLKSSIETLVIPAFEMSCKAMFEQVDGAFRKGMSEHSTVSLQHFDSSHSSLTLALRDALNSASSVTQILSGELVDGQRKLLSLAANSSKVVNPLVQQITNGTLGGCLHEKVEAPLDPAKELARLIAERKYEEAFNLALQRSDVSIVSWLCSQVDLSGMVSMNPLPISQGVLISLLQQLSCDIVNDSSNKLLWMRDILIAINTNDPMIAVHVRPIFQQVYSILDHRRNILTTGGQEQSNIRLIMHVINSMLMTL